MNTRILLASMLMLFLAGVLRAQEPSANNAATIAEIGKVQAQESEAIKNNDAAALCSLLADGWAYTNQMGRVIRKAQWCSEMTDGTLFFRYVQKDDVKYHVFGDTVVATGRSTSTMVYHRKVSFGPRRFSITFVKLGGQWKECAYHVSLITNEQ
ncbi:MAG: nuclear transport factor 2 family protein [Terriglobia bacterium]